MKLHPAFIKQMQRLLQSECPTFLEALDRPPVKALRVNTLKITVEEAKKRMPFLKEQVAWCDCGFYHDLDKLGNLPLYIAGLLYSQDASAMAPAEILNPLPGERVLDLCAAPGGKTTQLAAKMQGRGLLFANELVPGRAKVLYENIERCGIANSIVLNESPARLRQRFPEYFDKILVDAPCSGEGMFRKDSTALREWNESTNLACSQRQRQILESAAPMLKAGGTLVYSTCTFSEEENEAVIERFLSAHPDWTAVDIGKFPLPDGLTGGTKRVWPHLQNGEGHFIAKLRKNGGGETAGQYLEVAKEATLTEFRKFEQQTFVERLPYRPYLFGDKLALCAEAPPDLKGLKCLNVGIHAGRILKNRFEPHHHLCRCVPAEAFTQTLVLEEEEFSKWCHGETLRTQAAGWCGVLCDRWCVSWGKAAGGILKNHYPKGLRTP